MIKYAGCSISKTIYQRVTLCFYITESKTELGQIDQEDLRLLESLTRKVGGGWGTSWVKKSNVPGVFKMNVYFDLAALAFPDTTEGVITQEELAEVEASMIDALNHTAQPIKDLWRKVMTVKTPAPAPTYKYCESCNQKGKWESTCDTCHEGSNHQSNDYYTKPEDNAETHSHNKCVCDYYHEHGRCKITCPLPHAKPITKDFQHEEYLMAAIADHMFTHNGTEAPHYEGREQVVKALLGYYQKYRTEFSETQTEEILDIITRIL